MREVLDGATPYREFKNLCIWAKTRTGSLYRSQHELVFVFKSGKEPHINNVELDRVRRNRTNVWNYAGVNSFGKEMNIGAQTGIIESGLLILPEQVHWLDAYVDELTTLPNSEYYDQVDSTSQALECMSSAGCDPAIITNYKRLAQGDEEPRSALIRIKGPHGVNLIATDTFSPERGYVSREVRMKDDDTFEVTEEEAKPFLVAGYQRVADDTY
jgi:hypothetical protein